MLTHIHPSHTRFACPPSPPLRNVCSQFGDWARPGPPSAQSPFARLGCYLRRRDVSHLVGGRYPAFLAPTDSCVKPNPSSRLGLEALCGRSLQVVVSPCWEMVLPDVISAVCVKMPGPIPRSVLLAHPFGVSVSRETGSEGVGLALGQPSSARWMIPAMQLRQGGGFRGGSHSLMFRLLNLLGPPVAPTVAACAYAQDRSAAGPFTSRNGHGVTLHEL